MKKGFQRVKIDGQFYEIAEAPTLDKKYKHDIDVVVDRVVVRPDIASRLADSLETCLRLADGLAVAEYADKPLPPEETSAGGSANKSLNETHERVLFSEKFACPVSGFTIPKSSRGFSPSTIPRRLPHLRRSSVASRRSTRR